MDQGVEQPDAFKVYLHCHQPLADGLVVLDVKGELADPLEVVALHGVVAVVVEDPHRDVVLLPGQHRPVAHEPAFRFWTERFIQIEPIQYKGSAEYVSALVANEVQLAFAPEYTMLPLVKEGKLKILAVTGDTRSKAYPDAPLFSELGLPRIRNNWMAIFAPKGTSPALVTKLNADLTAIIKLPDVDKRIRDIYFEPVGSTADQLRRRVETEISEWTAVAKAAGIEPQ